MVKLSLLGIPHDENSSFLKRPSEAPPLIRRELLLRRVQHVERTGIDLGVAGRLVDHGDIQFDGGARPVGAHRAGRRARDGRRAIR